MSWDKLWRRYAINAIGLVAIFIWAGLVLLGQTTNWGPDTFRWWDSTWWITWAVILTGAGVIMLLSVIACLVMPEHRRFAGVYLIFGSIMLGLGLGEIANWGWGLIGLICAIGIILGIVLSIPRVIGTSQQEEAQSFKVSDRKVTLQANAQPESSFKVNCRNCGKELVGTPAFCVYCGAKVQIEQKYCPTCGAATYQSAVFCTKCGTRLLEV